MNPVPPFNCLRINYKMVPFESATPLGKCCWEGISKIYLIQDGWGVVTVIIYHLTVLMESKEARACLIIFSKLIFINLERCGVQFIPLLENVHLRTFTEID